MSLANILLVSQLLIGILLIDVKEIERKHKNLHKSVLNKIIQKHSYHFIILVSTTAHMALGGIYNHLPLLPIVYFLNPR